MVAAKTTTDLLTEVREEAQLPDTDGRLSAVDNGTSGILRLASKALSGPIASLLVSLRQERWVTTAADVSIVSGTARYRVPSRALAAGVADVLIIDGADEWSADEVSAADRWRYSAGQRGYGRAPFAYTWEGDHVVLLPTPASNAYALRFRYPRQPARLVEVSDCGIVTSTTATEVIFTENDIGVLTVGDEVDIVRGTPHGDVLAADAALATTASGGGTSTITFDDATIVGLVSAGDYVCLPGTSCVIPCPESVWPVLIAETVLAVVRALGDRDAVPDAVMAVREATDRAKQVLAPRNRGEHKMVIAHGSALRGGRFPASRGWR